jgi:hypothetical protein
LVPELPGLRNTFISLAILLLAACTKPPVEFTLVEPREPFDKLIANELVRAFDGNSKFRLTLIPHPDMHESSLDALASGIGDLALVSNGEPFTRDVETVLPLYPTVLHIAYRDHLQPKTGSELLIDTTVYAGLPGSTSREMMEETAHRFGIPAAHVRFVESLELRPDVVVVFAPVIHGLMDDYRDYHLFSIGTVEQLGHGSRAEAVTLLKPQFKPFILPTDIYPDVVSTPIVTLAVDELLVARNDIPGTVVYDLISELLRLKPALAAVHPGLFHDLTGDFDAAGSTFVLHPGAQAYIERDAPTAYERYSGVAEVAVTLALSLVSGLYAAVKIFRIRRKNRIDTFYKRAIAIRRSVSDEAPPEARNSAIQEIRKLQEVAFDLLVDEKLAADESFRIFITLCSDIVSELRA